MPKKLPENCKCKEEDKEHHIKASGKDCFEIEHEFCAKLCYAQVVPSMTPTTDTLNVDKLAPVAFVPYDSDDCHKVYGKIVLKFSCCYEKVEYRIWVYGACGKKNPNERVVSATLRLGRASDNGPVIAELFHTENLPTEAGDKVDGLLAEGVLTNVDLNVVTFDGVTVNTVASLFDATRRGFSYVLVTGNDLPLPYKPTFADGLIRGQLFAAQTTA